jgi:linoleoyl-CoA desaturase
MYFKTATIVSVLVATYLVLLLAVTSVWAVVPLRSCSASRSRPSASTSSTTGPTRPTPTASGSTASWRSRWTSWAAARTSGTSSTTPSTTPTRNINGHDDDIDVGVLGRLSPEQPRLKFHRLQTFYMWFLYGFLMIKWQLFDDFFQIARGKIGHHKIQRPRGKDLLIFVGGKVFFFSMVFVIPMLLHSFWAVLGVYLLAAFVEGVVTSIVFQLAHCVEEAEFPVPSTNDAAYSRWQRLGGASVQTTVDFARRNRVLCWLLGGLNFQIEHHLFHKICHVHYPALSKVVEETCAEFRRPLPGPPHVRVSPRVARPLLMAMGRPKSA